MNQLKLLFGRARYVLIALIAPSLFYACSPQKLDASALMNWVENPKNGFWVEEIRGELRYQAQFEPADYYVLKRQLAEHNKTQLEETVEQHSELQYFTLRISADKHPNLMLAGIDREIDYYYRQQYLTTEVQNDFLLIQGTDTLPCVMAHFEEMQGLAPYITLSVAFEQGLEQASSKNLVFFDRAFAQQVIELEFDRQALNQKPTLLP